MRILRNTSLQAAAYLLAALLPSGGLAAETPFAYQTLDYPGAAQTQVWGISPRGDAVGYYGKADSTLHGFRWSGGDYVAIDYPGASNTEAFGINARGDVVGIYSADGANRGFLLSGSRFTSIDYPGAERTDAAGINARGDIVGVYVKGGVAHGFVLRGSSFTGIDYPGASATSANGINDRGDIVGSYTVAGATHGFVLRDGEYKAIDYQGANFTSAFGINMAGDIVGRYRDTSNVNHGFLLSGDVFTPVDVPGSTFTMAAAINPAGDVVGRYVASGVTRGLLLPAQRQQRYTITVLGTLGGHLSGAVGVNHAGVVTGGAAIANGDLHPALWSNGRIVDMGTLGGANGLATNANGAGQVSVVAETVQTDPQGEDFCGFGAHRICLGAVWRDGKLTALPTLGGRNAIAFGMNERGAIAGVAEKSTSDASCPAPQVLGFAPVIWQADGRIEALRLPAGDSVGFAIGINDKGEAAGATGDCETTVVSAMGLNFGAHAMLWQNGVPTYLGTQGVASMAVALNNRSEVVGGSVLADHASILGFLWTRDAGMRSIRPLPADASSLPSMINNAGQVVGASCDSEIVCRAIVWERGLTMDLNEMVGEDSPLYLMFAGWINDAGEIVGQAVDKQTGEPRGFLARPVNAAKRAEAVNTARAGANRKWGQKQMVGRYGIVKR